ncbi:CRISPR-associated helicase, Cas3 family [Ruegeria intermedia]|uniref:CRISPR-associated helicase, Cas3 family n=1 Tax=Ruegeria intermedia TaxID=996115 RepID=A0A1M5B9D5_9RHOB|nr:CRISPR-associated helicase Cas3' [Ruegeria intermedia]SHF39124.1 CRISPR-associated helicase, Cas3 family [Ruegeria intermedia]
MTDLTLSRLARDWPGKSHPSEHPALWHMLDVGAVARHLLTTRPIRGGATDAALALLVALHDLGKISNSFRAMLREGRGQIWRHWEHSALLLRHHDAVLADLLGGSDSVRRILYEAIAGHHGGPRQTPTASERQQQLQEIGPEALADAEQAIRAVAALFPGASLDGIDATGAKPLSWLLNGLVVQSDWIGSNPDWFPPAAPDMPLPAYWARACAQAEHAVAATGLYAASVTDVGDARILPPDVAPRPMQQAARDCALPDGPVLAVIEDATGAGKTEAALILAARMMQAGKADGLFFALPTMATANAMLSRVQAAAPALFDGAPTLGLAHGRAALSEGFRSLIGGEGANPETGPHCTRWLADDRRRILLSDIGIGTIDQALFAVLPTRFNALRLRALARKVLIVDEAHSYDPYMEAQLKRLLTFQARLGGSAVVMTATLPGRMKQGFVTAFQAGLAPPRPSRGRRRPAVPAADPPTAPYPALTIATNTAELTAVNPAEPTVRRVGVTRLSDPAQAVQLITEASAQGAACIWVRNAVDDAIEAVAALRAAGVRADLLHARFAICDRLEKERALQAVFGKSGQGRAGRVLVATQVAEQSLDLDFDVMVSDLAPIGALIQRAGRLWRHMDARPAPTRPVPEPVLHVLSPDPDRVENARWLHQVLGAGAYIYPPTVTWRSARALFDAGELRAPDGLRALIEAVEGADPLPLPEALEGENFQHIGQQMVERQLAENCLISAAEDFAQDAMRKIWDDEQFPTRLGVPQVTLALARCGAGGVVPYAGNGPDGWAMSELQVSKPRFDKLTPPDQTDPAITRIKQGWSEARAACTIIAPLGPEGRICEGLRYDPELGAIWN